MSPNLNNKNIIDESAAVQATGESMDNKNIQEVTPRSSEGSRTAEGQQQAYEEGMSALEAKSDQQQSFVDQAMQAARDGSRATQEFIQNAVEKPDDEKNAIDHSAQAAQEGLSTAREAANDRSCATQEFIQNAVDKPEDEESNTLDRAIQAAREGLATTEEKVQEAIENTKEDFNTRHDHEEVSVLHTVDPKATSKVVDAGGSELTSEPKKLTNDLVSRGDELSHLRLSHSKEPIYDTDGNELTPENHIGIKLGHKKVTVVGCGKVGMAIAYAMLNQTTAGTIALIDRNPTRLEGEAKDLEQGSAFHQHVRILASDDYSVSKDSHFVIVTAGAAQKPGESHLTMFERNVNIMKSIIPKVLAFSPNAAICIVSNPCDLLTAIAAKIAGPAVPPGRIFGSGTCLDSSRLRSLIAKRLELDAQSVTGYVIGEHGDSSVPVWSSVHVGGVPIIQPAGHGPSPLHDEMHREVVNSAYDVIEKKGYTNWAVGLTGAYIANAVLDDTRQIMPVSTCVQGMHGIETEVFLSMPCGIGSNGVGQVIDLPLTPSEKHQFLNSAKTISDIQKDAWESI